MGIISHTAKYIFGVLEDINLFTARFQILHHIVEDVQKLSDGEHLVAMPSEHVNFVIKL